MRSPAATLAERIGARRHGQVWRTTCPLHSGPPSLDFWDDEADFIYYVCRSSGCPSATLADYFCAHYPDLAPGTSLLCAPPRNGVPAERNSPFLSPRQIADMTPEHPDWILEPYVARGALTEVAGKVKAAGKTTWITHAIRAVLDGQNFMGQSTRRTDCVYLTEQSPATFRQVLRRAGLLDRADGLSVLFWRDVARLDWEAIVELAVAEAKRIGAGLLVVDTLGQFAGLQGDQENDPGPALAVVKPLQEAAAQHNLGVGIVRHERKAGGAVGDAGRGSSAFAGAVDIVLSIRRPEGAARPTLREIHAISRYDETPALLVVELTADGYVAHGARADVAL
jgi:hypothetical protein